ncbi:MAG: hypothetical protein AB7I72_18630 [Parvibaculaceae bacterium]
MKTIDVDYEILEPAVDLETSIDPESPQIWPAEAPGNLCYD